jgi:hypothetical protein
MEAERVGNSRMEESFTACLLEIEELEPIVAPGITWSGKTPRYAAWPDCLELGADVPDMENTGSRV